MSNWQPMSTAPKDNGMQLFATRMGPVVIAGWDGVSWRTAAGGFFLEALAWQPLPDPPPNPVTPGDANTNANMQKPVLASGEAADFVNVGEPDCQPLHTVERIKALREKTGFGDYMGDAPAYCTRCGLAANPGDTGEKCDSIMRDGCSGTFRAPVEKK